MAELVETYVDLPLGIVDAAVIAIAERLRLTEIATLDHRHFTVVRPRHTSAFVLLPRFRHCLTRGTTCREQERRRPSPSSRVPDADVGVIEISAPSSG
jgi:hypothetical protein